MLAKSRRESEVRAAAGGCYDVVVVGGGIHGATICRDAALAGYKVLLLEAKDYAFGTSSRSSKMLHGGVRYLEQGNFGLVGEALRERELLIKNAPHLARVQDFFFPIIPGFTRPAWQVKIGLSLYDFLARSYDFFSQSAGPRQFGTHSLVSNLSIESKKLHEMGLKFSKLYRYIDAQMDDARITIENIVDSKSLGATTLNYAKLEQVDRELNEAGDNAQKDKVFWRVKWSCGLSNTRYDSRARFIINATGSWAPQLHSLVETECKNEWSEDFPETVFSRGSHLLFDVPWRGAGLILPTGTKGRYYFVWPYFTPGISATLVGTTDCCEETNNEDPLATQSEIDELLSFLKRDLPDSRLNESTLYRTFSGLRTLVRSDKKRIFPTSKKNVSSISRTHSWFEKPGYLALFGGKFTNSRATAEEASRRLNKYFNRTAEQKLRTDSTRTRALPGGEGWTERARNELIKELLEFFVSNSENELQAEVTNAVERFGMCSRYLMRPEYRGDNSATGIRKLLIAQIRYSIIEEQSHTIEDILRRRLGFALHPEVDDSLFEEVGKQLLSLTERKRDEIEAEIRECKKRWFVVEGKRT